MDRGAEVDGGREGCESPVDSNSTNPGEVWATARLRMSGSGCCQPLTYTLARRRPCIHIDEHGRMQTQSLAHIYVVTWEMGGIGEPPKAPQTALVCSNKIPSLSVKIKKYILVKRPALLVTRICCVNFATRILH